MSGLSEQQLSVLSDLIGRQTGLHFPHDRYAELERGLGRASRDFGLRSVDALVGQLTSAELSPDQIQKLAWHLTIGETYFLRGGTAFQVLEREILPKLLLGRKGQERQLRLWSAGCAGGEEPYSLAITVSRLIPDIEDWHVTILATDINTRALQKAQEGTYGTWSFRDTPDWLRPQFFTKLGNGDWQIKPRIKKMVTFSYLNLAADPYPSLATNTNAMDVIFCRNVIMYFSQDMMRHVIGNLHESLREGGSLFVAPSEASQELFPQFKRVTENNEIFFRRDAAALAASEAPKKAPAPRAATPATAKVAARAPAKPAPKTAATAKKATTWRPAAPGPAAAAPAPPTDGKAAELAGSARARANEGRLGEALELCEQAIAVDKLTADYRYLCATILEELDRSHDAIKALNSALYLEPDFVLAHFLRGNIARRQGQQGEAEHQFRMTLALLQRLDPDDLLPESEGMTAGKLAEIVKSVLQLEATT
jgi:chemotaxis protein methyltransferase CheR